MTKRAHSMRPIMHQAAEHLANKRRHQRFKLETEIKVYSRATGLRTGRTVDISESGISAIMKVEATVGELVDLEFRLPLGPVYLLAVVRQRNAFRYGFEFLDAASARDLIVQSCHELVPC